ncbi:serine hydrolase domain-containing protein [Streptomyces sp. NPDC055607]
MREQASRTVRPSRRQKWGGIRRRAVTAAAVTAVGVLSVGLLAPPAGAGSRSDPVQRSLNALVSAEGLPGALASVEYRTGRSRDYTSGVGDLAGGWKVPTDGQVRIGSNTKAFTAVVVLQLVAEGKIGLDSSVETYLPGLVRGMGVDGRRVTVRQLLQHTSGIPNYTDYDMPPRYYEPRELVDVALQHEAVFAPGTDWAYSNTNYVLAGLIVQRVTGRPVAEQIDKRVVRRIGLRHTYFPAVGDMTIREPHPKGYYRESADVPLHEYTELDPSWAWTAGQMISTNSDLNQFYQALLSGRLLPEAQLDQMRTTVPVPAEDFGPGVRYGLGLVSRSLSCGGIYWGHGGDIPGFHTRGGVTEDGRAAHVAVTALPADRAIAHRVETFVDTALCR